MIQNDDDDDGGTDDEYNMMITMMMTMTMRMMMMMMLVMMSSTTARQSLVPGTALVPPLPAQPSLGWIHQHVNGSGFPLGPSWFPLRRQYGGFHLMTAQYVGTATVGGTLAGKVDSRHHK